MPLVTGGKAPYAPSKTVQAVIARHRAVRLPKVDLEVLERLGVTEPLRPRTLSSLKLLDFYDEDGRVTHEFDNLQRVPEGQFQQHLAELLKSTYAPVIEMIGDPAEADPQAIEDAFRTFEPRGQLARIVQLFTGLMVYAGVMDVSAKRRPGPTPAAAFRRTGQSTKTRTTFKPREHEEAVQVAAPAQSAGVQAPPDRGHRTTVFLDEAGSASLIVDVNTLLLAKQDRDVLFDIVDRFNAWREKTEQKEKPVV